MLSVLLLLLTLGPVPIFSQNLKQLSLPSTTSETISISLPSLTRVLPASTSPYNLTITLCSLVDPIPRFFLSNDSSDTNPGPDKGGTEILFAGGLGSLTVTANDGGTLVLYTSPNATGPPNWSFEIGLTPDGENPLKWVHNCGQTDDLLTKRPFTESIPYRHFLAIRRPRKP